ncbi:MAG: hypothetical protein ACRD68_14115 [Pyrinomonadaceae bacterium]
MPFTTDSFYERVLELRKTNHAAFDSLSPALRSLRARAGASGSCWVLLPPRTPGPPLTVYPPRGIEYAQNFPAVEFYDALAEASLGDWLALRGIGWPGAAGVLRVVFEEITDHNVTTLYVPWEPSAETPDGFRLKLRKSLARFGGAS